ncbi:MAG: UDP-glucose 4-epimerase GalE [Pseudomonadota bacterium]
MPRAILVTGGAGYVGSHTAKALAGAGYLPVVYDDFRRGNRWAVKWGPLVEASLEDADALLSAMRRYDVAAVMHFAAYAYVGESMADPSLYFRNNVANSAGVLDAMVAAGVPALVISSTCASYGVPPAIPISEDMPLTPINPYGASKVMMEDMAKWYGQAHGLRTVALRYFNAAGADPQGEIGECHDPEPHIIPLVIEAALGTRDHIAINGTDYPTHDGTAVRDYVHVSDLARAHVAALQRLLEGGDSAVCNLGTGRGVSIRQIIECASEVCGQAPTVKLGPRRPGDPPELVADPGRARSLLHWQAERSDLPLIMGDAVRWTRDILPGVLKNAPAGR